MTGRAPAREAGAAAHEFYVGYLEKAPPRLGRFLSAVVGLLVLGAGALAALIAYRQAPFEPGVFEFGIRRTFEGRLEDVPHPILLVEDAGGAEAAFQLVGVGKHGAGAEVAGFFGRRVRLGGTLIYREGETMLEVVAGSVELAASAEGASAPDGRTPPIEDLGPAELVGEIVDSKCYLGVMKPGRGRTHRACAALCLRGGIPPILVLEDPAGERRHVLLLGAEGAPLPAPTLDLVALPVRVRGRLERRGDRLRMLVTDIRRMG